MKLIVAGGGTGGHLFPGLAVADAVRARGGQVLFVGTARGLEARVVPAAGYPFELVQVSGLARVGPVATVRGLARVPAAIARCLGILRRFRPDVVLGVGGYASGPMLLSAWLARVPTAIQEQNSVPGLTNRVLGRLVRAVFLGFPEAERHFPRARCRLTGNPVRAALVAALAEGDGPGDATAQAAAPRLLVVGGSQGARALNQRLPEALALLRDRGLAPRVLHQAGAADEAVTRARYTELGLAGQVEVRAFLDDMVAAYRGADLVVARAGALTLAELALAGLPAVLIPLPTAAGDHQRLNAEAFVARGAARLLPQAEATPERLAEALGELCAAPGRLREMTAAMRALARPRATEAVADALAALAARGRPR